MRRPAWKVSVNLPQPLNPFALPRKARLVADRVKPPTRAMKNVTELGSQPVRCITVAAPSGLYVTRDYVVTHNSHARMCPASQTLFDLIVQGVIAHDGDPILAAHVAAAVAKDTGRGWRLVKRETSAQSGVEQERRARRPVDLAIALAIAASRAQTQPGSAGVFFIDA